MTTAMAYDRLPAGRGPLCPACDFGELRPYKIEVSMQPWQGVTYLSGWVLVCKGRKAGDLVVRDFAPCGFSLPVQAMRMTACHSPCSCL
jgi:hypothetical protein